MTEITMDQAMKGVQAGVAKAKELNSPSSIAVVDSGRNLLAFARMDGALLASIEISQGKAYTARSLNLKTSQVSEFVQPGAPLYGLETTHRQPLVVFGGGVPVTRGDTVIGAVGVAGGTTDDDEAIATAVAEVIGG
jgi:uncharacterized protein GlcG (DUF336 family)